MSDVDYSNALEVLAAPRQTIDRSRLRDRLVADTSLDPQRAKSLIEALTELAALRHSLDSSAEEISARTVASPPLSEETGGDDHELADRIARLIDCPVIRLVGKAVLIGSQHERIFADAQILTDLRPIFGNSQEDELPTEGTLLTHILRLHYIAQNGRHRDFFVALDDDDLTRLREQIDRADRKSASLRRTLLESSLSVVTSEE